MAPLAAEKNMVRRNKTDFNANLCDVKRICASHQFIFNKLLVLTEFRQALFRKGVG
jgi:hypothetical protein